MSNSDILRDEESTTYEVSVQNPQNFKLSQSYLIGIDIPDDEEAACLTVVRRDKDRLVVVNTFTGELAIEIYNMLITKREEPIDNTTNSTRLERFLNENK